MKREQKAFVMLMAACMAFTGISSLMSASAAPVSLNQAQIGNYLDDGARNETSPAEIVLPSSARPSTLTLYTSFRFAAVTSSSAHTSSAAFFSSIPNHLTS